MKKLVLLFLLVIPTLAFGKVMLPTEDPSQSRGIPSTTITDIEASETGVWIGTGRGVAYQLYGDSIWNAFDTSNGLSLNGIASMYAVGDTIYVALATDSLEALYSYGLVRSFDNGYTWDEISLDTTADSILAYNTTGWERIVFDISGKDSVLFAASKVAGLIASFNNGDNWRPVYLHYIDSANYVDPNEGWPPYSQRYFSLAVDSTHTDSLILWAGTPVGVRRFIYAPKYAKFSSNFIMDITTDGDRKFVCGDSGLTSMKFDTVYYNESAWLYLPSFLSYRKDDNNLPGTAVTTAFKYGDKLFVGTIDSVGRDVDSNIVYGEGTGIAMLPDGETQFTSTAAGLDSLLGENRYARQFAAIDENLFMAGYEAGLFVSPDSGLNWNRISVDTLDSAYTRPRNIINTIVVDSTNLLVGTDSGLVIIRCDALGNDTLHQYVTNLFEDNDTTGARVYNIGVQRFYDDVSGDVDSLYIWTLIHPVDTAVGEYGVYYTRDYGTTWKRTFPYRSTPVPFYDIAFKDDHAILAGRSHLSADAGIFWLKDRDEDLWENINGQIYSLEGLDLLAIYASEDTVFIGSENGFAEFVLDGSYNVFDPHLFYATTDPQQHVGVDVYVYPNLTGTYVNAIEVQDRSPEQAMVWMSTHPGPADVYDDYYLHEDGITSVTADGRNWTQYTGMEAWAFAFNGDTVFAATSEGLLMKLPGETDWELVKIRGTSVSSIPTYETSIDSLEAIYSLAVIHDTLWVGSDNGLARIDLMDIGFDSWDIYRISEESMADGVYAYPIPLSLSSGDYIHFHYDIDALIDDPEVDISEINVTIEVYDFAMDLIKTVADNIPITSINEATDSQIRWDGRNGKGDDVAIGIYYYKMSLSNGEVYWRKLAIEP